MTTSACRMALVLSLFLPRGSGTLANPICQRAIPPVAGSVSNDNVPYWRIAVGAFVVHFDRIVLLVLVSGR